MNKVLICLFIIISFFLSSCASFKSMGKDIYSLESRITRLENSNKELTEQINKLSQKNQELEKSVLLKEKEINDLSTKLQLLDNKIPNCKQRPAETTNNTFETTKQSNRNNYSSSVNTYSRRYQAITKKGTQCKRTAQSGSKYCWQHSR